MAVKGKERAEVSTKKVGLFEAKVIAVNPTVEEYQEILGIELPEESKMTEYLGTSRDGNTYLRVDIWSKNVKSSDFHKVSFYLEDSDRTNKDGNKDQFINDVGICSWAEDESSLPDWFAKRAYRKAKVGEEELYEFLRYWIAGIDYMDKGSELVINWKRLMKGNISELTELIDSEYSRSFVGVATITTKEQEGEMKEFQGVYNKAFLHPYNLAKFRLIDYMDEEIIAKLQAKAPKTLKAHERFVLKIMGEYGCKDYFILRDLQEYDPSLNIVAEDSVHEGDPTY